MKRVKLTVQEVDVVKAEEDDQNDLFIEYILHLVKADDALPPVALWYKRLFRRWPGGQREQYNPEKHDIVFRKIQALLMRQYKRRLRCSFVNYLQKEYGME